MPNSPLHRSQLRVHKIHDLEFANISERTSYNYLPEDVGKVYHQIDNNKWYLLTADTPVFLELGGAGGSPGEETVLIEDIDFNSFYVGRTAYGNPEASNVWQIKKMVENGSEEIDVFYADGSLLYDKNWTDRDTYTY